jgi:predicted  nucleic acid-binding Zn-ribbon protein
LQSPGASEGYVRASEFEALKAQVALLMSRQQGSQQQGVSAPLSASGALNAAAALAETDEQLEALRAQQAAAAETISKLNSELGSVKRQLAAVVDMVGDAQHLSSQVSMSRSLSIGGGASAAAGPPGDEGTAKLIQALQATLDDMSTRMAAAEAAAAAAAGADAVVNLEKDMAALSARIAANAAAIAMASSMNGPAGGSAERSATGELAAESALSELRASVEELQAAAAARAAAEAERTAALAAEVSALRRELEATRKGSEEGLGSLVVSSMVARATTGMSGTEYMLYFVWSWRHAVPSSCLLSSPLINTTCS